MKFYALKYSELILTVDTKTFTVESGFRITKGMNNLFPNGLSIAFKNREFDTKSLNFTQQQETRLIQILKRHPSYGTSFISQDHNPDEEHENIERQKQIEEEKRLAAERAANTDHKELVNKNKK